MHARRFIRPSLALLLCTGLCANALAAPEFPASRGETSATPFDLNAFAAASAKVDHRAWDQRHPGPWSGWFSPENDDCAAGYIITWGPLGIRTRMHDHTWGGLPAFRRAWPAALCDAKGDLLFDCFEVVSVIPGSPADGHLKTGDLLVAMDGAGFRTALALHPGQPLLKYQESRSLEMDAGERLDVAEGRGRVAFDVIRTGGAKPMAADGPAAVRTLQTGGEMRQDALHEVELDVKVAAGDELALLLELTRKNNGSCGSEIIRPRLEGPAGTLDLSAARRMAEANGWGRISRSAENGGAPITHGGQAVAESLWCHAPAKLAWVVPPGYDRFRATVVCRYPAEGYRARVEARQTPAGLPAALKPLHQVVAFDIPKIGSYGAGFPNRGDAKSAMVAKMTAAWLAGQQKPDGSWDRTCGYTHNSYDTAWAGLGLLAQADPAYDAHIRKAAEYIAFHAPQDGWAVPNSVMVMFLSEYWLRTRDDRILTALQSQVERLQGEMVYGDWNGGHGHNPGYGGSGVSTGGSHMALAFALAAQTPVRVEPGLVDRMLARAQELGPDGYIPYGRGNDIRKFEPNLAGAGTYSGRHGPYLLASYIAGGPRLFTENCAAMYAQGDVGGMDQGHATQSLSLTWGLLAAAAVSPEALERHMAAMRWKFTMLRCHDGGFCQNAYRLEYQGGEGLLPAYLRAGAYLVMLNSAKHNMAMTGAKAWRATRFPDLPPVCHNDAVCLGYYRRNWGVADAVLGSRSPAGLRQGLAALQAMGKGAATRAELYDFLKANAAPAAREILALKDADALQKQYLAEMLLGVDLRLSAEPLRKDDKAVPGRWAVTLDAQHPLAGYFEGAAPAEREAWRKQPPLPMQGTVEIAPLAGGTFGPATFAITPDCGQDGWQVRRETQEVAGPDKGPVPLVARIRYRVGDIAFDYARPITAGADEPGNGEKGRKVTGDRVVWVPGRLYRDLGGWNASFTLAGGQFIAAATQGVAAQVEQGETRWVAPTDGALPAGSRCLFGFDSGWQGFEARVSAICPGPSVQGVALKSLTAGGAALDPAKLADRNRRTGQSVPCAAAPQALVIEAELAAATAVRAVDLRLKDNGRDLRMTIEAESSGRWRTVFQGRPDDRLSAFQPVTTGRLRITLTGEERFRAKELTVEECQVFAVMP